jgi:hypothetical protein
MYIFLLEMANLVSLQIHNGYFNFDVGFIIHVFAFLVYGPRYGYRPLT